MKGQILKISINEYFVLSENKQYVLPAKGTIKYKGEKLIVGDFVEFENGIIKSVYPRSTRFLRPNVANVDCVNIVVAPSPLPDYLLIDKVILSIIASRAKVFITVNKCDLSQEVYNYFAQNYSGVAEKIFHVSAVTGEGIEELKTSLCGKLCAFAGQSAVGKTSLCNAMFSFNKKVGEVSDRIMRGKNTTTYSEIHYECGCGVVDTPGFSALLCDVKSENIKDFYPEFIELAKTCYYIGCKHSVEPDCAVKEAVLNGSVSKDRYNRYIEIYKSCIEEEKRHAKY